MNVNTELVQEAVELLEEVARIVEASGLMDDPSFRAYQGAQLQGKEHGWMGDGFLIDVLRLHAQPTEECQVCGGYTGADFDILQDSDECEC